MVRQADLAMYRNHIVCKYALSAIQTFLHVLLTDVFLIVCVLHKSHAEGNQIVIILVFCVASKNNEFTWVFIFNWVR